MPRDLLHHAQRLGKGQVEPTEFLRRVNLYFNLSFSGNRDVFEFQVIFRNVAGSHCKREQRSDGATVVVAITTGAIQAAEPLGYLRGRHG